MVSTVAFVCILEKKVTEPDPLAVLLLISANITLKEERTRRRRKVTRTRKRQEKKDQTAWERKLKETKETKGGLTKVVHENNGMRAEYFE